MHPFREFVRIILGGWQESREMLDKKKVRDDVDLERRLDILKIKIGLLFFWVQDPAGEERCVEV